VADALAEVGDVVPRVGGEDLARPAELPLIDDVAVQREQLADREPVLDADHGRRLPTG
jgi:hypothetical protein